MKSATDMPGLAPHTEVALQAEDIRQERLRLRKQALVDATSLEGDL